MRVFSFLSVAAALVSVSGWSSAQTLSSLTKARIRELNFVSGVQFTRFSAMELELPDEVRRLSAWQEMRNAQPAIISGLSRIMDRLQSALAFDEEHLGPTSSSAENLTLSIEQNRALS